MLYTITIEVECEDVESAKDLLEIATDSVMDACDTDNGEAVHTWKVNPT